MAYVSRWGTGELRRYDVSVPDRPKLTSVLQIGGIARRAPHPKELKVPLNGGPQMVEISRDGKRVYQLAVYVVGRAILSVK